PGRYRAPPTPSAAAARTVGSSAFLPRSDALRPTYHEPNFSAMLEERGDLASPRTPPSYSLRYWRPQDIDRSASVFSKRNTPAYLGGSTELIAASIASSVGSILSRPEEPYIQKRPAPVGMPADLLRAMWLRSRPCRPCRDRAASRGQPSFRAFRRPLPRS